MRASYDTAAMRACAGELDSAAASLTALARQLDALPRNAVPAVVHRALDDMARQGADMVADIGAESTALTQGLLRAAQAYDDMDASLVRAFGP